MSLPEVLLWQRLKGSPQGISFRKQHPVSGYRIDFYCPAAKLIIEVDGIVHDMGDQPARDEARTADLERQGCKVVRVLATDILRDPDAVADAIVALARSSPGRGGGLAKPKRRGLSTPVSLASRPLHHQPAAGGPPPRKRGGS